MGLSRGDERRWVGPACAVVGVLGFSFKAILIKLAYAWHPVDAVTLLALRMLFSAPFFVAMAWWAGRRPGAPPIARRDWLRLAWLGFIGYYLASLLDFMGLAYITASLERLVLFLYPTMVVLLSALLRGRPHHAAHGAGARCSPTRASRSSSRTTCASAATAWRRSTGGALVFGSALALRALPGRRGRRDRAPGQPALHRLGDARLVASSSSRISR